MKKVLITVMITILLATNAVAAAGKSVNGVVEEAYVYSVDGVQVPMVGNYKTLEYNGRAYVPIRFVSDALGIRLIYDQNGKLIRLNKDVYRPKTDDERCPWITTNDKMRDLEKKLEELKRENADLKDKLKKAESSVLKKATDSGYKNKANYNKPPVALSDGNVEFTVESAGFDAYKKTIFVTVKIKNVNSDNGQFAMIPSESILMVSGKEYKANVKDAGNLYNTLNNKDDILNGTIYFNDLVPEKDDLYTIKLVYTDANGSNKKEVFVNFRTN